MMNYTSPTWAGHPQASSSEYQYDGDMSPSASANHALNTYFQFSGNQPSYEPKGNVYSATTCDPPNYGLGRSITPRPTSYSSSSTPAVNPYKDDSLYNTRTAHRALPFGCTDGLGYHRSSLPSFTHSGADFVSQVERSPSEESDHFPWLLHAPLADTRATSNCLWDDQSLFTTNGYSPTSQETAAFPYHDPSVLSITNAGSISRPASAGAGTLIFLDASAALQHQSDPHSAPKKTACHYCKRRKIKCEREVDSDRCRQCIKRGFIDCISDESRRGKWIRAKDKKH